MRASLNGLAGLNRRSWGVLVACVLAGPGAALASAPHDGSLVSTDGVRLHTLEAGPDDHRAETTTIVLVPGWTMPAWIWGRQIAKLSAHHRVVALDPRGQGDSDVPASGYTAERRGRDIAELIATLGPAPVLLVGWSLGVLDSLAYVREQGDAGLAGLVLIDNSVGETPAPLPQRVAPRRSLRPADRAEWMAAFVRSMFHRPMDPDTLDRLTETALRTPAAAAAALLRYDVPRETWKAAILSVHRPVLYVVTPRLAAQAQSLAADDPWARTELFADAGHALFVDDAARFDALLGDFIAGQVWPPAAGPRR